MRYILIVALLIPNLCLGDVKYLDKGSPAPFAGYLFDVAKEREVRGLAGQLDLSNKKVDILKKVLDTTSKELDITNQRVELYVKQNENLAKQLTDMKSSDFWNNYLYFGLGVLSASALAYAGFRVYRGK